MEACTGDVAAPVVHAMIIAPAPRTPSNAAVTAIVATTVAIVDPSMLFRASAALTPSPPRAGRRAFAAMPEAYAQPTRTNGTRLRPGYAARRTPHQAVVRKATLASWKAIATATSRRSSVPSRSTI